MNTHKVCQTGKPKERADFLCQNTIKGPERKFRSKGFARKGVLADALAPHTKERQSSWCSYFIYGKRLEMILNGRS